MAYSFGALYIDAPTPIEAVKFRMEQMGLSVKDMEPFIGRANRVYEVLNGKRDFSVTMMRRLYNDLHIPAEALLGSP